MNDTRQTPALHWDLAALNPYRHLPLLVLYGSAGRDAVLPQLQGFLIRRECPVDFDAPPQGLPFPRHAVLQEGIAAILAAVPPVYWRKYALELAPFCEQYGLLLLDTAGHDLLALWRTEQQLDAQGGNTGSAAALRRAIRAHDVISFDFFDTLFCRTTLAPQDTFARVAAACGLDPAFAGARDRAERALGCATLEEIYRQLAKDLRWDDDTRDTVRQCELDWERRLLMPRRTMLAMLRYALRQGKTVCVVSDTALPAAFLRGCLTRQGLPGDLPVWVSCEKGCTKYAGLFAKFRQSFAPDGLRFLHIGDNRSVDGVCAELAGFSHFLIAPVETLCRQAGAAALAAPCRSWNDRLAVGMVAAGLFNDPFAAAPRKLPGLPRFGALALGPLAVGYLLWAADRARQTGCRRVIFPARDGYLFHKLYRLLRQQDPTLPAGVYLPASRGALLLADLETRADQQEWLHSCPWHTPQEILTRRFLLPPPTGYPETMTQDELLDRYGDAITGRSRQLRQGYRKLLARLHLTGPGRCAFCDLLSMGTSQLHLERLLEQTMQGLYLHRGQPDRPEKAALSIEAYMEDPTLTAVSQFHFLLEFVFSSPSPSLHHIDPDGTPVYEPEKRSSEELRVMQGLQHGVQRFARSFFALAVPEVPLSAPVTDALLRYLLSGAVGVQDPSLPHIRIYDDWSDVYLNCFS